MPKNTAQPPDWESVLSAAARLQGILPDTVLVGGTASAIHVKHRLSADADHVLPDLKLRFDAVLAQLESAAGWETARVNPPVLILGSLDGIETGVRQLRRKEPLETMTVTRAGQKLTIPTLEEILRIKGFLILRRNATRDYVDFAALADRLGADGVGKAMRAFDRLYPQDNGQSALQQLQAQLANPLPFDLQQTSLTTYKNLDSRWHDWNTIKTTCTKTATAMFDYTCSDGG